RRGGHPPGLPRLPPRHVRLEVRGPRRDRPEHHRRHLPDDPRRHDEAPVLRRGPLVLGRPARPRPPPAVGHRRLAGRPRLGLALRRLRHPRPPPAALGGHGHPLPHRPRRDPDHRRPRPPRPPPPPPPPPPPGGSGGPRSPPPAPPPPSPCPPAPSPPPPAAPCPPASPPAPAGPSAT